MHWRNTCYLCKKKSCRFVVGNGCMTRSTGIVASEAIVISCISTFSHYKYRRSELMADRPLLNLATYQFTIETGTYAELNCNLQIFIKKRVRKTTTVNDTHAYKYTWNIGENGAPSVTGHILSAGVSR